MPGRVIASKVANALVATAEIRENVSEPLGDAVGRVLDRFRARHGGLWVGGRVTLTDEALTFVPNGLNRALQQGVGPMTIDLAQVAEVENLPGFFTKIIALRAEDHTLKIRCYRAPAFAEVIRSAVAARA